MRGLILAISLALFSTLRPALAGNEPPPAPPAATDEVARGNNAFALELHRRLSAGQGNVFFSPYSLESALAMTWAGARGQTAEEMRGVLGLPDSREAALAGLGALQSRFNPRGGEERAYELAVANALWAQAGYPFNPDFSQTVEAHLGAGIRPVDYVQDAEGAREKINAWVEEATRERIRDLIPPGLLDELTRLVLVNAIYFKGEWAVPFRERSTKPADFHVDGGEATQVPTMHRNGEMLLFHDEQLQALQLPYAGGELAMLVLLPRQQDGLAELEAQLTLDRLDAIVQGLAEQQVELALPRFRMETQFELSETLQAMGMRQAFGRSADLTGIATAEDLYVKAVVHKAFVEVNEEGTEAAGATGVVVAARAAPREEPQRFAADRPFLFLIRDVETGTILFMGRVSDPRER